MRFIQKSIDQTGVAVFELEDGDEKVIPLFSLTPYEEALKIREYLSSSVKVLKNVYYSNNMMKYKIEDKIEKFVKKYNYLPEELMYDLASGFPYTVGEKLEYTKKYYK
jgi:hypothetical protein